MQTFLIVAFLRNILKFLVFFLSSNPRPTFQQFLKLGFVMQRDWNRTHAPRVECESAAYLETFELLRRRIKEFEQKQAIETNLKRRLKPSKVHK